MSRPEIGRELTAAELVPKTVCVLSRAGRRRPHVKGWFIRSWCSFAEFRMGRINTLLFLQIAKDGTLRDDKHNKITVNEYLGKV